MKNIIRVWSALSLVLISQAVWSFSIFDSTNPSTIMNFIEANSVIVYLSTFFVLGILLAFTPCVLPMVPILSGIIVGQRSLSSTKAVKLSISYVLGMAITYAVAGMVAGWLGSTIQTIMQRPSIIIAFSSIFVVMALSLFGIFEWRIPTSLNNKLNKLSHQKSRQSHISVALMGILSALVVSPCVTAPLIGVLAYIGQSGQAFMGGLILFIMALGMGVPLILVGVGYGSLLPKTGPWMIRIKHLFGIMMIGIAIWMLARILPETIIRFLWAGLLMFTSIGLGCFKTPVNHLSRFLQIIGVVMLISGGIVAYSTADTMIHPVSSRAMGVQTSFLKVNTLEGIEQQLMTAKNEHKPVFIEFYATWCSDCQAMEKTVFNQSEVKKAMNGLLNLKVDISDKNNQEVQRIKKAFSIYGIPTLLFYDNDGKALKEFEAAGYVKKEDLLTSLHQIHTN